MFDFGKRSRQRAIARHAATPAELRRLNFLENMRIRLSTLIVAGAIAMAGAFLYADRYPDKIALLADFRSATNVERAIHLGLGVMVLLYVVARDADHRVIAKILKRHNSEPPEHRNVPPDYSAPGRQ